MLEVAAAFAMPGAACEPLLEPAQQLRPGLGPVVGVARDVEAQGEQSLLQHPRGRVLQAQEAADHQVGAGEQGEAERDLAHHQRRLQPLVARPRGGARAVAERGHEIRARGAQGRKQAGHERGERGHPRGEGHDPPVEVGPHPIGQLLRPGRPP